MTPRDRKTTAYHEAGHAVIANLLPECDDVHLVTIVPRGQAGGYTLSLPNEENDNYSRTDLLGMVTMAPVSYTHLDVYKRQVTHLVLDLEYLTFMDSSGIGMLLGRLRALQARGGSCLLYTSIMLNWCNRVLFAHVIKRYHNIARSISSLIYESTPAEANKLFDSISRTCDYYNICLLYTSRCV